MPLLDVMDKWVNEYGIVAAALVSTIVVTYVVRGLPTLRDHLNHQGTFRIRTWWLVCVVGIAPIVLGTSLVLSTIELLTADDTYSGYPGWFVFVFVWLIVSGLVVVAIGLSLIPWPACSNLVKVDTDDDPIAPEIVAGQGLDPAPGAVTPHELRSAPR